MRQYVGSSYVDVVCFVKGLSKRYPSVRMSQVEGRSCILSASNGLSVQLVIPILTSIIDEDIYVVAFVPQFVVSLID